MTHYKVITCPHMPHIITANISSYTVVYFNDSVVKEMTQLLHIVQDLQMIRQMSAYVSIYY